MSGFVTGLLTSWGEGYLQDRATEFAEENFQPTKDPFYEKLPNGKQVRRRLPDCCSKQESKAWKSLQNKAWSHDRSICGCCCWTQCVGWAPIMAIIPVIGPALMYWVHGKLINYADRHFHLPPDLLVKLHGNIGIDLAISLIPILGILFSWLHASSTRNCAMIYNFVSKRAYEREAMEKRTREQQAIQRTEVQQHYDRPPQRTEQAVYHSQQQYQRAPRQQQQVRPPPPVYQRPPQAARAQRPYL
ncbi:hypothetical protein HG536_0C03860 [Torulaspora globosa]|uniref:Uncharacterized protein n=1 Tax=Torulaspora globosa TaxID=48254 RepID=A0A7G3ZFD1_9SACH|nr:uncharacterized protein HG536_0C03860 [Torulaspora globosa]QLL32217.1 hypothetical protein HG536_0C03860 [Torulaspora globosa]